MDQSVPPHPRIVPELRILRRRPDEIQVGLDPRLAAVVSGLPEPVVAALQRLNGQELEALVTELGEHGPTMRTALVALATRGLVEDASKQPLPLPARLAGDVAASAMRAATDTGLGGVVGRRDDLSGRRGLAVEVRGDGRVAVAVACLLAGAGVGWVHVAASGSVRPEDIGTGYLPDDVGRRRTAAAKDALRRVDAAVRTASFRTDRHPDLVVLADSLVHEPANVEAMNSAGVPQLAVRMRDGIGIVGPLVLPGWTSCLRCADLHRCDLDEHWPGVALQLAGQTQLADLAGTQATAALAAHEVLEAARWLEGLEMPPKTCEATLEIDLAAATVRHRSWPVHPACTCGVGPSCSNVAANTNEELRESRT
jgi:bacteriocin biosynthesis cyclodehydratase domain-containing protein